MLALNSDNTIYIYAIYFQALLLEHKLQANKP